LEKSHWVSKGKGPSYGQKRNRNDRLSEERGKRSDRTDFSREEGIKKKKKEGGTSQ